MTRIPLVGGLVDAATAAAGSAVSAAVAVPRSVVHAVLDDVFDYLSSTDLTGVILSSVDLNRVLATVDLDELLARVDLNAVLSRVDVNEVLAGVDLNALLARVDVDAVLARTDLVGVAEKVVDGVDVTAIVREASATVSTEVISDVRIEAERADDGVEQFVNRMLRRKGPR